MRAKRRILLLITDLQIGGTPTVVRELAIRLRSPEIEIEVACLAEWGPVATQLRDAGIPVLAFDARSPVDLPRTLWRLGQLIRDRRFDTVFSFLIHANACAVIASARFPDVRFLQSIQTTQPTPTWHWRLQRIVQLFAQLVIVPSPATAAMAAGAAGVPPGRIVVIPNAVDLASFDEVFARNAARSLNDAVQIGFIGRLDPVKRVPHLIEAMPVIKRATESRGGCHLHVYGEGTDRGKIEKAIDRLGLGRHVTLHGAVAGPHDALAGLDTLVLPSTAEGFGLVLIEAMAAGVPVVAARSPGITDVVSHGLTGVLFDTPDPDAISSAIRTAIQEPTRSKLIQNGRREVASKYDWPSILRSYRQILNLT